LHFSVSVTVFQLESPLGVYLTDLPKLPKATQVRSPSSTAPAEDLYTYLPSVRGEYTIVCWLNLSFPYCRRASVCSQPRLPAVETTGQRNRCLMHARVTPAPAYSQTNRGRGGTPRCSSG
ncbi:unnamed protein product, partial [Ectocarpus sp. 12 AP-2014]